MIFDFLDNLFVNVLKKEPLFAEVGKPSELNTYNTLQLEEFYQLCLNIKYLSEKKYRINRAKLEKFCKLLLGQQKNEEDEFYMKTEEATEMIEKMEKSKDFNLNNIEVEINKKLRLSDFFVLDYIMKRDEKINFYKEQARELKYIMCGSKINERMEKIENEGKIDTKFIMDVVEEKFRNLEDIFRKYQDLTATYNKLQREKTEAAAYLIMFEKYTRISRESIKYKLNDISIEKPAYSLTGFLKCENYLQLSRLLQDELIDCRICHNKVEDNLKKYNEELSLFKSEFLQNKPEDKIERDLQQKSDQMKINKMKEETKKNIEENEKLMIDIKEKQLEIDKLKDELSNTKNKINNDKLNAVKTQNEENNKDKIDDDRKEIDSAADTRTETKPMDEADDFLSAFPDSDYTYGPYDM